MKFDWKKILEVSKKNWVSISLGVVMLIGLIAVFTFVSSQQADLQKSLADRKKTYDSINALLTKTRHQPVVSPDSDAVSPDLKQFPNKPIIASGEFAIKGVQDQSMKLKGLAQQMNVHPLLLAGSLPVPRDPYQFQQVYLQQFTTAIPTLLQSVTPPTEVEIKYKADQETAKITADQPHTATGEVYNKEALQQALTTMMAQLPEQMRREAATKHRIYMAPTALSIHPALAGGTGSVVVPDAEKIWLAQMGLWVQGDVISAIAQLNAGSKQVDDSVVKQLVQLYISPEKDMYVIPPGSATPGAAGAAAPSGAPTSDSDPLPRDYTVSPTGRVCNGVFDVVQFYVVLTVQAKDVERVISELERDRLLTVVQSDVQAVNSMALQQQGYYFGKTPVVTLTLKCEDLFLRSWTAKLMPDSIKKYLNVQETPQPGQPTASAG